MFPMKIVDMLWLEAYAICITKAVFMVGPAGQGEPQQPRVLQKRTLVKIVRAVYNRVKWRKTRRGW